MYSGRLLVAFDESIDHLTLATLPSCLSGLQWSCYTTELAYITLQGLALLDDFDKWDILTL